MEIQLNSHDREKIIKALESSNKIEAIKICRDLTGGGLKECKDYVELLISELIERDPEKYSKLKSSGFGCGSAAIFFVFTTTGLMALLEVII